MNKAKRNLYRRLIERNGTDCYYCGLPMYIPVFMEKEEFLNQFGILPSDFGVNHWLRHVRSTKEHIVKREHGGSNSIGNLVLAHSICNTTRLNREPEEHGEWVKKNLIEAPTSPLYIMVLDEDD